VPSAPTSRERVAAVVMAAGKGTRLRSSRAKVLHEVAGRSLLHHVLAALEPLGIGQVVVVVGHQADDVADHAVGYGLAGLTTVVQEPQLGTGHAVEVALAAVSQDMDKVVVVNGDVPLVTPDVLAALADTPPGVTSMLTAELDDPTGYGRVLRGDDGRVVAIVEHRDATAQQRTVNEVNAGMYAFDRDGLADHLAAIGSQNDQGERYVTTVVEHLVADGSDVRGLVVPVEVIAGVNDREQLASAGAVLRRRHLSALMRAGVTVTDPAATWVDVTVDIEPDAQLLPGCMVTGASLIGEGAVIGPHTTLHDTEVGAGARVAQSSCDTALVAPGATVGPFAHLRPGTELGPGGKIGAFAEVKKSTIGAGSKIPHLSYVGDATIGEGVNFACGAVTVNYDGTNKYETVIGDGAFIGCDTMLIAPVEIGAGAYVAAGSTITDDVPADALAIARSRQTIKEGWALRQRGGDAGRDDPGSSGDGPDGAGPDVRDGG
jgi:bifunctional UDP-N-acetylglucosamine pyrophosphorylase/glucosamine-1-phosphate N-acetyltransferase